MSVQVKRGEFQLDPRLLANQQKILQYLRALQEDQRSLRQDIGMIKKESKHFQRNVYENFQHISADLNNLQECVDDLSSSADSINNRTKSVYKHVKSLNMRHDRNAASSDTDSNARLPKRHNRDGARQKNRRSDGYLQPTENHLGSYSPDTGDSDTDYTRPLKVNLPKKDYNNSDPNLLQSRSNRNISGGKQRGNPVHRSHNEVPLSDGNEAGPSTTQSLPQINIRSPVQLQDQPPENIPKPGTKKAVKQQQKPKNQRNLNEVAHLPLHDLMQYDIPYPRLMKTNCGHKETVDVVKKFGLEMAPGNIEAIERASHSRGAPRRQVGLRSVFILDTSGSMAGDPWEKAKTFLVGVLENLDASADKFALEEYISILTFGEKTGILQPFTNDYVSLKGVLQEDLEQFEVAGKSPLLQALAAALTYIECNGDAVILQGHVILPRIVIISDFSVTNEHNLEDNDVASREESVRIQQQIFNFMAIIKKRRYQTYCVPVGGNNQNVCEAIARLGDGTVIQPEDTDIGGFYYRYQVIVANCLDQYNATQNEGQEEDIDELVEEALQAADMPLGHRDIVCDLIAVSLSGENNLDDLENDEIENDAGAVGGEDLDQPRTSSYQQRTSPVLSQSDESLPDVNQPESMSTGGSFVDLPEWRVPKGTSNLSLQEIGRLPQLGSRVQRGKDWAFGSQDGQGPGTVVGHKAEGMIFVLWDNNNQFGTYRFGYQGDHYDVEAIKSPRLVQHGQIEIGCWVVRGSDWSQGDEDGGQGTVGVVIRKLPDRIVQIRWPSRVIDTYKFGADEKWEVKVVAEESMSAGASRVQTPESNTSNSAHGTGERPAVPGEEGTQPVWRWQDRSYQWRLMSPDSIDKLEQAYKKNIQGNVMVQHKGKNAKVYLATMECEINDRKCPLQREIMTVTDFLNLQMLEEMITD